MATRTRNLIIGAIVLALLLGLCTISVAVQAFGSVVNLRSPFVIGTATPYIQRLATTDPNASASTTSTGTKVLPTANPVIDPVQAPPQGVAEQSGNIVHLFIVNPESPDQTQVRHPQVYVQTNVSSVPVKFVLDVPQNYIGIIGGFAIDNLSNGVYEALPPGTHNRTITNGFGLIIRQTWALDEWNFRLNETRTYGWTMQTIKPGPLGSSDVSIKTTAASATKIVVESTAVAPSEVKITTSQRQATGTTGTLPFPASAAVCGNRIVLSNGRTFNDVCFHSAPSAGTVTNGVIFPFEAEFKAANIDPK